MKKLLLIGLAAASALTAQKVANADWPMYARDVTGRKFSPLKQINASNVAKLKQAWTLTLRTNGAPTAEVTPIVIGGIMYLPSESKILALEAHTGKQLWAYEPPAGMT